MKAKHTHTSKQCQILDEESQKFSSYKYGAAVQTALLYFGCRQVISFLSPSHIDIDTYYHADEDDGSENGGFECPILTHVVLSFDNRKWLDQLTGTCGDVVDLWAHITFTTRKEAALEMMKILDHDGTNHEENPYLMGYE